MELLEVSDGAPTLDYLQQPQPYTFFVGNGSRASNFWPAVFFEGKKQKVKNMF